jgi:amidophosphoribosyltransferase
VYFASAAPPIRYQNLYGIDMAATEELVAHNKTEEEICVEIGADKIFYQQLDDLISSAKEGNPKITDFEISIFNGEYPTPISSSYLEDLEISRSDSRKITREAK